MSAAKEKDQPQRSNPLKGNKLFSDPTPAQLSALPPLPTAPTPLPIQEPDPVTMPEPTSASETQPLYRSRPSAEYRMRPFDHRYDKQAINVNPYYTGAMEALSKITRTSKTEQLEEMMRWYLSQHEQELQENEDLVLFCEQKYREKFRL